MSGPVGIAILVFEPWSDLIEFGDGNAELARIRNKTKAAGKS